MVEIPCRDSIAGSFSDILTVGNRIHSTVDTLVLRYSTVE